MEPRGYARGDDSAAQINFTHTRAFLSRYLSMDEEVLRNCSNDEIQRMLSQSVLESSAPFHVDRSRPPRWSWRAIPEEKHNRMPAEERRERRRAMKKYIEFISNEIQIPVDVIREMDAATFDAAHKIALARKLAGGNSQTRRQSSSAPSSPQRRQIRHYGGHSAPSSPGKIVRFKDEVEQFGSSTGRSREGHLPSSLRDPRSYGHLRTSSANRSAHTAYPQTAHPHASTTHSHGHGPYTTYDANKAHVRTLTNTGTPQQTHHGTPVQVAVGVPQPYKHYIHVDQSGVPISTQYVQGNPIRQDIAQPTAAHAPKHGQQQQVHSHHQAHQPQFTIQHASSQPVHAHSPAHHLHQAPESLHHAYDQHVCSHGHKTPTGQSPHVRPIDPLAAAPPPPVSYTYVGAQGVPVANQTGHAAHPQSMQPVHVQGVQMVHPPMQVQGVQVQSVPVTGHSQPVQYVQQPSYVMQQDPRYMSPSLTVMPNPAVPSPSQHLQGAPIPPIIVTHPDPSATNYPLPPSAHSHHH